MQNAIQLLLHNDDGWAPCNASFDANHSSSEDGGYNLVIRHLSNSLGEHVVPIHSAMQLTPPLPHHDPHVDTGPGIVLGLESLHYAEREGHAGEHPRQRWGNKWESECVWRVLGEVPLALVNRFVTSFWTARGGDFDFRQRYIFQ